MTLISAEKDLAVPPDTAHQIAAKLPSATAIDISGYGHLVHEEAPERIADIIRTSMS